MADNPHRTDPGPSSTRTTQPAVAATALSPFINQILAATRPEHAPTNPVRVTVFNGAQDVDSWLKAVDVLFLTRGITEDTERFRWVRSLVTGQAADFFEALPGDTTWTSFRTLWRERLLRFGMKYQHRTSLHNCRQIGEDIEQYIHEF